MQTIVFEDGNNVGIVYRGTQLHSLGLFMQGGVPMRVNDKRITCDGKQAKIPTFEEGTAKQKGWTMVDIIDAPDQWTHGIKTPCRGLEVIVRTDKWNGTKGVVEDQIPGTEWWNVRVTDDIRLALKVGEFQPI